MLRWLCQRVHCSLRPLACGPAARLRTLASDTSLDELWDSELEARLQQAATGKQQQQQEQAVLEQPGQASSAVPGWTPLASSDPWAPLPGPALARRRLPQRLQWLLETAGGVSPVQAAAAIAEAIAAGMVPAQQRSRLAGDHHSVLARLPARVLQELLLDCEAPVHGGKAELVARLAGLLQAQASSESGGSAPARASLADEAGSSSSSRSGSSSSASWAQPTSWQGPAGQVAATAAARSALLASVCEPQRVAEWLLAARAQDVAIIDPGGRVGGQQGMVLATGLSQRHVHACAAAVAWQLQQAVQHELEQHTHPALALLGQQQLRGAALAQGLVPRLRVLGDDASDWAVLDAGRCVLHVLTARARAFYDLERLHGGAHGQLVRWVAPQQRVQTKDTIGRPGRGSS